MLADPSTANMIVWAVAAATALGVIVRPFGWPEAVWALAGAALLVGAGLLPARDAWTGIAKGEDVYAFLTGMMILSELARREGVFDWLAALATSRARGSAHRLFWLIYLVGTLVTVFLSNDATAVVLTPAIYAATQAAKVRDPLPYLYVSAFVANAASFVLPISNPANLVVYGAGSMPPLGEWLRVFALPSGLSIVATGLVLWWMQRARLAAESVASDVEAPSLETTGRIVAGGIAATALVLLVASALGLDLGLPTLLAGLVTAAATLLLKREGPLATLRDISWGVLPLVAGLFVIVEALDHSGVIRLLSEELRRWAHASPREATAGAGLLVAVASNLVNNLPAGLVAGSAVQGSGVGPAVSASILVGVDLGPNLSVTGSLATILWLVALRREGVSVGAWRFLRLGLVVTPPALLLALVATLWAST